VHILEQSIFDKLLESIRLLANVLRNLGNNPRLVLVWLRKFKKWLSRCDKHEQASVVVPACSQTYNQLQLDSHRRPPISLHTGRDRLRPAFDAAVEVEVAQQDIECEH